MSDINTPGRAHPQGRPDQAGADEGTTDEAAPAEDMSSYNIQPPPVDASIPGVPDASDALEDTGPDEPGANATGVGV